MAEVIPVGYLCRELLETPNLDHSPLDEDLLEDSDLDLSVKVQMVYALHISCRIRACVSVDLFWPCQASSFRQSFELFLLVFSFSGLSHIFDVRTENEQDRTWEN